MSVKPEHEIAFTILKTLDDPLIVCDGNGLIRFVNDAFCTLFGYPLEAMVGRFIFTLGDADTRNSPETLPSFDEMKNGEYVLFDSSRNPVHVVISVKRLTASAQDSGRVAIFIKDVREDKEFQASLEQSRREMENCIEEHAAQLNKTNQMLLREINERKSIEIALRESEYRYALAAQGANDGLWDWNLNIGEIYYSQRFKDIFGYEDHEMGPSPEEWLSRIHADDVERVSAELKEHLAGKLTYFSSEHRIRTKSGEYCWVHARGLAVKDKEGEVYRIAGSLTDISARKKAEEKLLYDASHDNLTGLPNRSLLRERLKILINKQKHRGGKAFAVFFIDLDRFKFINDTYGHLAGDIILMNTAQRLVRCLRDVDTVIRLCGDEFVVLMEDVEDTREAVSAAGRIQSAIQEPFTVQESAIFTSVSIGIVLSRSDYNDPDEVLRDADTALLRAKYMGRAQHAIFDPLMQQEAREQIELEKDLREAIGREDFSINYQPIVSIANERLIGFEALLRWNHPCKGVISPDVFIPLAEDTDLILPLGKFVLRKACKDMAEWLSLFGEDLPYSVSVNISAKQLKSERLVDDISSALMEAGLSPGHLVIEITESSIIKDMNTALSILLKVKDMGVRLHLDDFGQGYSSINLLHKLPFDTMKIDRGFVTGIAENTMNRRVVETIIGLGHTMHKQVIAEGIEDKREAEALKRFSCEQGQGFLYAKPMTKSEAEAYMASQLSLSK